MKTKPLPRYALFRAWLMLSIATFVMSLVSTVFPDDSRLWFAYGMVIGVELWYVIKSLYELRFGSKQEAETVSTAHVTSDRHLRLNDEEFEAFGEFLETLIEKREDKSG